MAYRSSALEGGPTKEARPCCYLRTTPARPELSQRIERRWRVIDWLLARLQ